MDQGPLSTDIVAAFDAMPAQLQTAARYVLDHPQDVALLSMREQARLAGVQPATMTRLAKRLGLGGYDEVRARYADAMRGGDLSFAGRAQLQVASQKDRGDRALASDMIDAIRSDLADQQSPEALDNLIHAADTLTGAQRVFAIGLRSSFSVAWHFHYILSLLGERCVLLDGPGGTGIDQIRGASGQDALLAISVSPYTRGTVEVAQYAAQRGVPVIAITDSKVAPLARIARGTIFISTRSPSFFDTMAPAFVMAEILGTLIAGRGGDKALDALRAADAQIAAFDIHLGRRTSGGAR